MRNCPIKGRRENKAKTGRFGNPEHRYQTFAMHNKRSKSVGQQLWSLIKAVVCLYCTLWRADNQILGTEVDLLHIIYYPSSFPNNVTCLRRSQEEKKTSDLSVPQQIKILLCLLLFIYSVLTPCLPPHVFKFSWTNFHFVESQSKL